MLELPALFGDRVIMLRLAVPLIFVLIWSTGFIVAKAALPHADLQLFLVVRFSLTALVMGCAALIAGVRWPERAARDPNCWRVG